jgi:cell division transport system permease protein
MVSFMSLTEPQRAYSVHDVRRAARRLQLPPSPTMPAARPSAAVETPAQAPPRKPVPQREPGPVVASDAGVHAPSPIIPSHSVAGRALLVIIAIMSFLAAATLGTVVLVRQTAAEWQGQVSREFTIQVRPVQGRDIEADVAQAAALARATPGIGEVRVYTREESARLLEPWLGGALTLDELPIPRLIVVTLDAGGAPDTAGLRQRLATELPNASLDDHRAWVERMQSMAQAAILAGSGVLALMVLATVLLVGFATRGAMTANRAIVEVLHFVGAKNQYIASQFQRHFLRVGLKGAALGGGVAAALFLGARLAQTQGDALDAPTAALVGALTLGPEGYGGMAGMLVLIAAVTALTSRWTVHRTLNALD